MAVIWAFLLGILCSDVWYSADVIAHRAHQQNKAVSLITRGISDEIIEPKVTPSSLTALGQGLGVWLVFGSLTEAAGQPSDTCPLC